MNCVKLFDVVVMYIILIFVTLFYAKHVYRILYYFM